MYQVLSYWPATAKTEDEYGALIHERPSNKKKTLKSAMKLPLCTRARQTHYSRLIYIIWAK